MSSRAYIAVIVILAIIIFVLAWLLFTTPVEAPTVSSQRATSTAQTTPANSASNAATVTATSVSSPARNETVAHTFDVSGSAPNIWFFEATFPIQVRDPDDNLIATAQARAQSDWTQHGMIKFTSKVTVNASYSGPATLILLKDNPSGDPENSDEITVPIIVR